MAMMPKDRLLLETDGPFGEYRVRPLHPWQAELAIPVVAEVWKVTASDVARIVKSNLRALVTANASHSDARPESFA